MKRSFWAFLMAVVCLLLATTAFSQAIWPDPCSYDPTALVGPGKPFQSVVNRPDGYYRLPISIANMGYWDGSGVWYWWTSSTFPTTCLRSPDGGPSNLFYDPGIREGTAIMPMCKNFPCQSKRYNYQWHIYNNDPTNAHPRIEFNVTNFEFRYKHYEDGRSKLNVVFRAGLNVMVPQFWWEPNICIVNPSSCQPPPPPYPTFEDNVAWGIVGNFGNPDQSIVFYADPSLSRQFTLEEIEYAKIQEENNGNWVTVVETPTTSTTRKITQDADNRIQFMSMNYDASRSWWSAYDLVNLTDNTESLMTIEGWEPAALKKYRLILKIKNDRELVSNTYTCPNYSDLGFIPSKTHSVSITTKKGKEIEAGGMVSAIVLTEKDGKLIVKYTEPELFSLYDSGIPQAPPPAPNITGSHVRIGLFVVNTPQLTKGAWIRVPAHLGTVVVPTDVVAWIKNQLEYTGTIEVVIHQRDNYLSGFNRYYTDTIRYTFAP